MMSVRTGASGLLRRAGRTWRRFRTRAIRVLLLHSDPQLVALGAAVGVFTAMLPCVGFQMILAVLIATALGANRLAAAAFVWVSNPLFFYIDYVIGRRILTRLHLTAAAPAMPSWYDFVGQQARNLFLPVLVGSLVFGLLSAALTYIVGVNVVSYYRRQAALRRAALAGGRGRGQGPK